LVHHFGQCCIHHFVLPPNENLRQLSISSLDWFVLGATLLFIVAYGTWVTRGAKNVKGFLLGNKEARWWTVGLSVMATQASAITFLSTPGQAFHDGMGFVQFYFGLPIAMVIICVTFIPLYHRLKVYTAYEYLETRFDVRTRCFTAVLFLVQRGLAAGITIFAPAIVLSTILGWDLKLTNLIIGILVIIYTMIGGTKAVSVTQKQQMAVIFAGLIAAFYIILSKFPADIGFVDALQIAGASEKMNILDFSFDLNNRYTVWTGLIGGTFLMLSYFGTDQSQVQRYLSASTVRQSQIGLIFNGLMKVPMQFFILLIGVMVFVFYQFNSSPVFFNVAELQAIEEPALKQEIVQAENSLMLVLEERKEKLSAFSAERIDPTQLSSELGVLNAKEKEIRQNVKSLIKQANPKAETNDKDYVFIYFILNNLPKGLIGLLLAVIFSAAMSSTASELNALASTTTMDIYKRLFNSDGSDKHYVLACQGFTLMWGIIAIMFANFGTLFENLIQLVNIIGSIFYGTILGIFLVGFYFKRIGGKAVLTAGIITQILIILIWWQDWVPYLTLNMIGAIGVILLAFVFQPFSKDRIIDTTVG